MPSEMLPGCRRILSILFKPEVRLILICFVMIMTDPGVVSSELIINDPGGNNYQFVF